jgi:type IX secretion system PorP/SprF family membrane protein
MPTNPSLLQPIKTMRFLVVCFIFSFFFSFKAWSQDIQFSQFYAAATYLNPAFAGSLHQSRVHMHQRIQWPQLESKYITSLFAYDNYIDRYNSGVGFMAIQDFQGANNISSTEAYLQYAYELNLSRTFSFRAGFQGGIMSRQINYNKLLFPSQFNNQGFQGGDVSANLGEERVNFFDVSSGGLLYSERLWVGFSAHHMNQPNQSFLGGVSRLPMKMAAVAGYKIYLDNSSGSSLAKRRAYSEISITPTVHYKFQGNSDQLDVGLYGTYFQFFGGIWYRGIPFKKIAADIRNNESVVFIAGLNYKRFRLGYSYDATVSKLTEVRTGGSHEITLAYFHKPKPNKRKMRKTLPCPPGAEQ